MNLAKWITCVTILFFMTACATQGVSSHSSPAKNSGIKLTDKQLKDLGIKETQGSY